MGAMNREQQDRCPVAEPGQVPPAARQGHPAQDPLGRGVLEPAAHGAEPPGPGVATIDDSISC